jgi:ribosome biogenesis GTPase
MNGVVVKSTGSWYKVRLADNSIIDCRLRGKFRNRYSEFTNPVAVGDKVAVTDQQNYFVISEIHDRENVVLRKSNKLSSRSQIIAANTDQVILLVTLVKPKTSTGFIDRYLVACESFHIPVIIIFNKKDLCSKEEIHEVASLMSLYRSLTYVTKLISVFDPTDIKEVRRILVGKTSLLAGHSGVGKSTLINTLDPLIGQAISDISEAYEKGKHTTTFAQIFSLGNHTNIIDTPGIKDFGLVDMNNQEIGSYFREIKHYSTKCKYDDCLHIDEPDCEVKKQVLSGGVGLSRYQNYLGMLNHEKFEK